MLANTKITNKFGPPSQQWPILFCVSPYFIVLALCSITFTSLASQASSTLNLGTGKTLTGSGRMHNYYTVHYRRMYKCQVDHVDYSCEHHPTATDY